MKDPEPCLLLEAGITFDTRPHFLKMVPVRNVFNFAASLQEKASPGFIQKWMHLTRSLIGMCKRDPDHHFKKEAYFYNFISEWQRRHSRTSPKTVTLYLPPTLEKASERALALARSSW